MRWLKIPYDFVVFYCGYAYFAVVTFAWNITSAMLYPFLPRRAGIWLGRHWTATMARGYFGVLEFLGVFRFDLSALQALQGEGSLIVAPNHPSLLDYLVLTSQLPHLTCIMKAGLRGNPLYGGCARLSGYIGNEPPLAMVRGATAAVAAGSALLIFPEGTRTREKPVNGFKGGFALIAKSAHAPVQTVFIDTDTKFLSKGWPLWKKPALPMAYKVRLGRRFEVNGDVNAFVTELEEYYRGGLAPEGTLESTPAPTRPMPAT
jgi:1-acyl-sn-glycerol-3-phosphate acyltransferase